LADTEPLLSRSVPCHGDFHPRQLLWACDTLHVVDLDSLCLGSPGLDLAEYAAEAGPTVVDALLAGYGARPKGFEWDLAAALLVRASHPFHRALPAWESRTEALLAAAEEAAP
jgi:thiamine kinase-like enzyme